MRHWQALYHIVKCSDKNLSFLGEWGLAHLADDPDLVLQLALRVDYISSSQRTKPFRIEVYGISSTYVGITHFLFSCAQVTESRILTPASKAKRIASTS